jgi:hypothetical protein
MVKTTPLDEEYISRPGLARRWKCHIESLKRREKKDLLHPIAFSARMIRYRMSEVLRLEAEAAGFSPATSGKIPGRFAPASALKGPEKTTSGSEGRHASGQMAKRTGKRQEPLYPEGVKVDLGL